LNLLSNSMYLFFEDQTLKTITKSISMVNNWLNNRCTH